MKKIEAIVRCSDLESLREQLADAGCPSVVATQATCLGEPLRKRVYRGSTYVVGETPVIKLEILVSEERVEAILDILSTQTVHRDITIMSIERVIARAQKLKHDTSRSGARVEADEPGRRERSPKLIETIQAAAATAHFRLTSKPSAS